VNVWTETHLWQHLIASHSPELPSIRGFLDQWMPKIERVLNAGTSPKDFTLHDADHSFRVAQRMAEIVPADVLPELSAYELALLLLSAYLHDIGMTPEQAQVERHWRHLVFGPIPEEQGGPSEKEAADLQQWLDDERGGIVPPLAQEGRAGEEDLRLAGELTTYYARHRHNDWSEAWIRQNAAGDLGSYEGWVDDLVTICRSHHEGYDELRTERFNPRPVGRRNEVVHLRYLACVLRIADILDMDPERTPPVVFHHRDIAAKSVIFWWKDHDLSIHRDGPALVVHARPRSAVVEKAVRDSGDWIRVELETCARLSREVPFSHAPFRASAPLPHRWDFPEALLLQVRPWRDAYVYIDGAFRPNTVKLLELLSGIQLYKDPLAAVRELLQNAFDAVKEEIALKRLEGDPADLSRVEAITSLQSVELRFEEKDGRFWLICVDSGVGMTRQIIENYLLVSGNSRRHEVVALERRCEAAGFRLDRTGQFGIGVLSYFMVADRVEIRTRSSSSRGNAESHGWWFETVGVGSFGELRKDVQARPGTSVYLRLREEIAVDRELFLLKMKNYILELLVRLPCAFSFSAVDQGREALVSLPSGWRQPEYDLFRDEAEGVLEEEYIFGDWLSTVDQMSEVLQWGMKAGDLPRGLGRFRIVVPYFNLPGGRSCSFLDIRAEEGKFCVGDILMRGASAYSPSFAIRSSFRGIVVQGAWPDQLPFNEPEFIRRFSFNERFAQFCTVDWEASESGELSVDRAEFVMSLDAASALLWLLEQARSFHWEILSGECSVYDTLNCALLNPSSSPSEPWWIVQAGGGKFWAPVSYPAIRSAELNKNHSVKSVEWKHSPVTILRYVEGWNVGDANLGCSPERVVLLADSLTLLFGPLRQGGGAVAFPPAWSALSGYSESIYMGAIWNSDHILFQAVEEPDLVWLRELGFPHRIPPLDGLLASVGRVAAFIRGILHEPFNSNISLWSSIERDAPGIRCSLWRRLFPESPAKEILFWGEEDLGYLTVLRADGFEILVHNDPRVRLYLPDPGEDWKLAAKC
jgi:hypothetical protein